MYNDGGGIILRCITAGQFRGVDHNTRPTGVLNINIITIIIIIIFIYATASSRLYPNGIRGICVRRVQMPRALCCVW